MFPYSFLPEEMKDCIVKSIHLNDTSQAFRASKSLERKILKYGPFPSRISKLNIRLMDSDYHAKTLDDLVFDIQMSNGEIEFEVSGHNVTLISKDQKIPLNVKGKTFWALLNGKITSLESCTINIWHSSTLDWILVRRFVENLFQNNEFLPKADYLFRLHLDTHLQLAKIILSRFHVTIRDLLALEIFYIPSKEKEANELLEDLNKRPTLQDCYSIAWGERLLPGAPIFQAPGKLLCFPCWNWFRFIRVIRLVFFQENPTASDEKCYLVNLHGHEILEHDYVNSHYREYFSGERGCEELRDDSEEAALIREAVKEVEKELEARQVDEELFIEKSSSCFYKSYYKKRFVNNEAIYFITCFEEKDSSSYFDDYCAEPRTRTFQCFVKYRTIKALDRTL